MQFAVLGLVRCRRGPHAAPVTGRLQRTLLGALLVYANQWVSADALADIMWPGPFDGRAPAKLQLHVHRLRRLLGETDRLEYGPLGYRLRVSNEELDVARFEAILDRAVRTDQPVREPRRLLREAMALWAGTPYEGFDGQPFEAERGRLEERRLVLLEELFQAELDAGRHGAVLDEVATAAEENPLRERLHVLRVTTLHRAGRRAEALEAYQKARRALVDELGLEPGPELRGIHGVVLAGEAFDVGEVAEVPVVAQLPAESATFVGRDAELTAIDRAVGEPRPGSGASRVCVVSGTAGVGKTALVIRWAHRHRTEFPDGQLHVDLRGFGTERPLVPAEVLARFLRSLGVDGDAVPADEAEAATQFRSLVEGRRLLIVLDNARSVDQVRSLLPAEPSTVVLITSRETLSGLAIREGANRIPLGRLDPRKSVDLLGQLLGEGADRNEASEVAARCANLPLALRVAAEYVRMHPDVGLAGLAAALTDEQERLDVLGSYDDETADVRAVLSWSYRALEPQSAGLFRRLGLVSGVDIDTEALAAMNDDSARQTRRLLDVLVRAHLVDETEPSRFRQHDLLRVYAAELAAAHDTADGVERSRARLLAHYKRVAAEAAEIIDHQTDAAPASPTDQVPAFVDAEDASAWLERETANILSAAQDVGAAGSHDRRQLCRALSNYFLSKGHPPEARGLYEAGRDDCLAAGDAEGGANAERKLGRFALQNGEMLAAQHHNQRALDLFRECGDRTGEATSLNNLGSVAHNRGDLHQAREYVHAAHLVFRELRDPGRHSINLANLATILGELGDYIGAEKYFTEAYEITADQGMEHGRVSAMIGLAEIARHRGAYEVAAERSAEALAIARRHDDPLVECEALEQRAGVARACGDTAGAIAYAEEATALARRVGHPSLLTDSLTSLAKGYLLLADAGRAIGQGREALTVAAVSGLVAKAATADLTLGDAYAALSDDALSDRHLAHALWRYDQAKFPIEPAVRERLTAAAERQGGSVPDEPLR